MRQRRYAWIVLTLAALLTGCGSTATVFVPTATTASTATATSVPTATATPAPTAVAIPVKVYFSSADPSAPFDAQTSVNRTATTIRVGTFALEQLILGPQPGDPAGLQSQTKAIVNGAPANGSDSCGAGVTFALTITGGIARFQFCVLTSSGGIGADARASNEITKTLKQFSTVSSVKICTMNSTVFGDESGLNPPC